MKPRFMVQLRNFSEFEADCSCGCGFSPDPELMLRLQSFIYYLERIYGCSVRCIISGGARCARHNKVVYGGLAQPSYHCGPNRGSKKDEYGWAVDAIFQIAPRGDWARIDKHAAAQHAIESKLFGGVGWKVYGPSSQFVHLDLGPVRTF